jgi:hypothetical protein
MKPFKTIDWRVLIHVDVMVSSSPDGFSRDHKNKKAG